MIEANSRPASAGVFLLAVAMLACAGSAAARDRIVQADDEICRIDGSTPTTLSKAPEGRQNGKEDNPLNRFSFNCLGLTDWSKYDVLSLNGQVQALSVASSIEIVPSYNRLYRTALKDGRIRASIHRFRIGGSLPIDGDKSATFADLSKSALNEGTMILGYEYGRVRIQPREFEQRARDGLEAARRDCLLEAMQRPASDPLRNGGQALTLSTQDELKAACDGFALSAWMKKTGANKYFKSVIQPQWRPREDATLYGGVEGRFTRRVTRSFFPLGDPAGTGTTPITQLPADFPANPATIRRDLYALKLYGGTSFLLYSKDDTDEVLGKDKQMAIDASLTYRRDLQFAAGTKDQTICPGGATIIACSKVNTAAPYLLNGVVLGGRAAVRVPRLAYLPAAGIEARVTYALDTEQIGLELPLYVFADAEGKTEAGVQLNVTGDGRTRSGYRLDGASKISVFFGRKFRLSGRP